MKSRRDFIKASIALPAIASIPSVAASNDAASYIQMQQVMTLPARDGKIVGMTNYRDKVIVATEYGAIYEIHQSDVSGEYCSFTVQTQQELE